MKSKQIQQKGSSKFVRLLKKILLNKQIYLMLIPVLIFYIIYCYVPMGGIVLAWKSYKRKLGIYASPWVGWENFELLFEMPQFGSAVKNTVVISLLNIVFCFPMPIIFALLLNEILHKTFKKSVQTMTYLPHFISWVIIGGLAKMALAYDGGVINNIVEAFGGERVSWLTHEKYFYPILIILTIWKDTGWGSIIYIAAISGIDTSLYEAARIDGCTRFGCIWRITVPCILPTIAVMLIMKIANIMNSDIISYHNYSTYADNIVIIKKLKKLGRPILNTEWLARCLGNTVEEMFPLFYLEKIGCYNWGFVAGKYQTYEPWLSMWARYYEDPEHCAWDFSKWFHDLYRPSLFPYDPNEIDIIKKFCKLSDKELR